MPAWWQTKTEKKKGALGRTKIIPKNANLHFFVPFFITNNELCVAFRPLQTNDFFIPTVDPNVAAAQRLGQ